MLASFFHGDWSPNPEQAIDDLLGLVVCSEIRSEIDSDVAKDMVRGYVKVWCACMDAEDEEAKIALVDDPEAFYVKAYLRAFNATRKRHGLIKHSESDENVWFPDCLPLGDFNWPKVLLTKIAQTIGEIEADRERAMVEYFQAQEKAG